MEKRKLKLEWDKVADFWSSEAGDVGVWHQRNDIDPIILKIIGDVNGKNILELGCGNGYLSRILAAKGARVVSTDISEKMIECALEKEKAKPLGIKYLVRDAANLEDIVKEAFDFALANMCLVDISDINSVFKGVHRVLKQNGFFIFSITHPVFFFCDQKWVTVENENKKYYARAVSRYLSSRAKKYSIWKNGPKLSQYHRALGTYFKHLRNTGFLVAEFHEIATKRKFKKAKPIESTDPFEYNWYEYATTSEKKMKEFASKEIPIFIVFSAKRV